MGRYGGSGDVYVWVRDVCGGRGGRGSEGGGRGSKMEQWVREVRE